MPLINCKVELKLKWKKCCVLSVAGSRNVNDNVNDNANGKKYYYCYQRYKTISSCCNFISKTSHQNFLAQDLKAQFIRMNIKQKEMIKIRQMNSDIFLNQTLL